VIIQYISYVRVSTRKQGKSGLGLEAQRETVRTTAERNGATILAEYVEVETGKSVKRPELAAAIQYARLTNTTLVVAKLDRLARNAVFLLTLRDSGLPLIFCDLPDANELTVGIMAVVAQAEAKMIAARTKAALAVTKAKGKLLGSARSGHWNGHEQQRDAGLLKAQPLGSASNAQKARERYQQGFLSEIKDGREQGQTLAQIAAMLNKKGIKTRKTKRCPEGGKFTPMMVWRLIDRYLGKEYLGNITKREPACAACN